MEHWKRMSSGRYVNLSNLTLEDIHIEDIEPALNYLYRFTGHHKNRPPLTVAQHSLLCMRLAEREGEGPVVRLACLVHDFAEAYIGDVATPVKKIMGQDWKNFADPIEKLVNDKFCPDLNSPDMHTTVKYYDLMSLDIERRCIWDSQVGKDKWPVTPETKDKLEDKRKMFTEAAFYTPEHGGVQLANLLQDLYNEM